MRALCTKLDIFFNLKYASHICKLTVVVVDHPGNIVWIGPRMPALHWML